MPNLIWNLSSKFAVKVDFSSGGCQKLPNWVKITDQNADLLQLVRKIFYSQSWRKTNDNLFYSIMQLQMHFFHFHLTTKSSNGMWLKILDIHGEFQFST